VHANVDEIIEGLVECGCGLNQTLMRAHGIERQLSRGSFKSGSVRRGEMNALQHNNSFNPTRDSMALIILPAAQVGCCSRGQVNSGVGWLSWMMSDHPAKSVC
jgi:hypothetical protein